MLCSLLYYMLLMFIFCLRDSEIKLTFKTYANFFSIIYYLFRSAVFGFDYVILCQNILPGIFIIGNRLHCLTLCISSQTNLTKNNE